MANITSEKINIAKKAAGKAAADFIQNGMLIGLGTGSTASCFIDCLIDRCRKGLQVTAVTTSERSQKQALQGGIKLIDINSITTLDITVDGADEIDQQKRMIKGGGGALLREKIVACMSKEMIVIVDSNKVVDFLGRFYLPVEICPFAFKSTLYHLEQLNYQGILRITSANELYRTDNGNYIYDVHLSYPCLNPERDHDRIRSIPGVIETGFFFKLAGRVIVGFEDGHTEIK